MREVQLKGIEKAELQMMNNTMTINEWTRYCLRNKVELVIEDGKVVGLVTKPIMYR